MVKAVRVSLLTIVSSKNNWKKVQIETSQKKHLKNQSIKKTLKKSKYKKTFFIFCKFHSILSRKQNESRHLTFNFFHRTSISVKVKDLKIKDLDLFLYYMFFIR